MFHQTMAGDTERKVVKTYVPSYQKKEWREHADELGMNQSEFVKSMVQAGRHDLGVIDAGEPQSEDDSPRGDGFEDRVLDILQEGDCSWDTLVESLTEDIEDRLEATLQRLQSENRVQYNGRRGGYTATDANDD